MKAEGPGYLQTQIAPPRVEFLDQRIRAAGRIDAKPIAESGEIGRYVLQVVGTGSGGEPNDGDQWV